MHMAASHCIKAFGVRSMRTVYKLTREISSYLRKPKKIRMPPGRHFCVRVQGSLQVMSRTFRLLNMAWYMTIHDILGIQHSHVHEHLESQICSSMECDIVQ